MKEEKEPLIQTRDHVRIALGRTIVFGLLVTFAFVDTVAFAVYGASGGDSERFVILGFFVCLVGITFYICFSSSRAAERVIRKRFVPEEYPSRACPQCGSLYKQESYRSDVSHVYCSRCKCELPRQAMERAEQLASQ